MLGGINEFIDSLTKTKKNLLVGGFLIGALALTVLVAQKQTNYRQRAAEITNAVSLGLSAPTTQLQIGQPVDVDVYLAAGDKNVTGVSFTIDNTSTGNIGIGLSNPGSLLSINRITIEENVFNNILRNELHVVKFDTYRYTAVDTTGKSVNGKVKLVTLNVIPYREGTATLSFKDVQITGLDQVGLLENTQNTSISLTAIVPTPTVAPPTATPIVELPVVKTFTINQSANSLTVQINASCKPDINRRITNGIYYFGDGTPASTVVANDLPGISNKGIIKLINTDHTYAAAGNYTVSVRCQDDSEIMGIPDSKVITLTTAITPTGNIGIGRTNPVIISPTGNIGIGKTNPILTITDTVPGDATGDGFVNILDYNRWKDEYLGALTTKTSDFNKDGKIDLIDFSIFRKAFNP